MRTLTQILESVIASYNNKEGINFVDLRDLDGKIESKLFNSLVVVYNTNEKLNFTHVRDLEIEIKNK